MDHQKQLDLIIDYIKNGEKTKEELSIGVEMEHFILHNGSLKTVSYYGKEGVGSTLKELAEFSFEKIQEGDYVLGLTKDDVDISTEPGSQFEIAIHSHYCIKELQERYKDFMSEVLKIFDEKDQRMVALGYHPVTKIDEITILPKKRYEHMFNYFKTQGSMAHNMMKGTASLQIVIDYLNEDDFKTKYRIANILSPVLYALFDNSYIFEGEEYEEYNVRQKIWENTDSDRSGVFELAFDKNLSYKLYAEKILNTPLIFVDKDGDQVYCGEKTLKDLMDLNEDNTDLIFHALSIVFPDVRVKSYIELRMMDAVPYPLNFACVALIKGLFYHEENLRLLEEELKDIDFEDVMKAKEETSSKGLQGRLKDKNMIEWGNNLVEKAEKGLAPHEKKYLEPLKKLLKEGLNPRDQFGAIYKKQGLQAAVDSCTLTEEELNA